MNKRNKFDLGFNENTLVSFNLIYDIISKLPSYINFTFSVKELDYNSKKLLKDIINYIINNKVIKDISIFNLSKTISTPKKICSLLNKCISNNILKCDLKNDIYIFSFGNMTKEEKESLNKYNIIKNDVILLRDFWFQIYQDKYSISYYAQAKDFNILKILIKRYGLEKSKDILKLYISIHDSFLHKTMHQLCHLLSNFGNIELKLLREKNKDKFIKSSKIENEDQFFKYIEGRKKGEYTGNEEWEKPYIEKLHKEGYVI